MPPTNSLLVSPSTRTCTTLLATQCFWLACYGSRTWIPLPCHLVQHGLGLASGLLVYFLGRRLFGPLVGLAAALLTVLDSELAVYEHAVMTEALFTFLLVGAISLLVLGMARYPWQAAAGFGLLLGLATLVPSRRPTATARAAPRTGGCLLR